ncbi:guanine nucleotide binding protein, partial [Reticulomyxa filosa]
VSGKTTVVKQLLRIHNEQEEKKQFDVVQCLEEIHKMVWCDIYDLCVWNKKDREKRKGYERMDEDCRQLVDAMVKDNILLYKQPVIRKQMAETIKKIWASEGIQSTFEYRRKQHVMDNTPFFLNKIDKLYVSGEERDQQNIDEKKFVDDNMYDDGDNGDDVDHIELSQMQYIPTWEDYLRIRDQTSGVLTYNIKPKIQNKIWNFRITDVGGQRSERKKWVKVFGGVNVVFYVMSLSGYDQVIYENNDVKCYDESFNVFHEVSCNPVFQATDFVLFLNKLDLFDDKLQTVPFTVYDTTFDEDSKHDKAKIIRYVQQKFESIWHNDCPQDWPEKRVLYFHSTCCLDTKAMQSIVAGVNISVIKRTLRDASVF